MLLISSWQKWMEFSEILFNHLQFLSYQFHLSWELCAKSEMNWITLYIILCDIAELLWETICRTKLLSLSAAWISSSLWMTNKILKYVETVMHITPNIPYTICVLSQELYSVHVQQINKFIKCKATRSQGAHSLGPNYVYAWAIKLIKRQHEYAK